MKSSLLLRLIKVAIIIVVLSVVSIVILTLAGVNIYDYIPVQWEGSIYASMHYFSQGIISFSEYNTQDFLIRDWIIGGLIIGWLTPALLFLITCYWGYRTGIRRPSRKKDKAAFNFPILKARINQAYWRARFLDLEKISLANLAVGCVLFITLLTTRKYYIVRFPFIDGATLFCYITYSYILYIHFLFFKGHSPRKILHLIDNKLQLKEGLLTLWDTKQFTSSSSLYHVLADRVQERVKKFKPTLIFPHKSPSLNKYNFIFPLVAISCMSFSTAMALPKIQSSLEKYLHTGIIMANSISSSSKKVVPLESTLLEQGRDLKELSKQLANGPNTNAAAELTPSLRKLGDELINLSKQKQALSVISGKNFPLRTGAIKPTKGNVSTNKAESDIFKALLQQQLAIEKKISGSKKDKDKTTPTAKGQLSMKEILPPIDQKNQIPLETPDSLKQTKGQVSSELRKLAMEILQVNLQDNTTRQEPLAYSSKKKPKKHGDNNTPANKLNAGGKLQAYASGKEYKKVKDIMKQLNTSRPTNTTQNNNSRNNSRSNNGSQTSFNPDRPGEGLTETGKRTSTQKSAQSSNANNQNKRGQTLAQTSQNAKNQIITGNNSNKSANNGEKLDNKEKMGAKTAGSFSSDKNKAGNSTAEQKKDTNKTSEKLSDTSQTATETNNSNKKEAQDLAAGRQKKDKNKISEKLADASQTATETNNSNKKEAQDLAAGQKKNKNETSEKLADTSQAATATNRKMEDKDFQASDKEYDLSQDQNKRTSSSKSTNQSDGGGEDIAPQFASSNIGKGKSNQENILHPGDERKNPENNEDGKEDGKGEGDAQNINEKSTEQMQTVAKDEGLGKSDTPSNMMKTLDNAPENKRLENQQLADTHPKSIPSKATPKIDPEAEMAKLSSEIRELGENLQKLGDAKGKIQGKPKTAAKNAKGFDKNITPGNKDKSSKPLVKRKKSGSVKPSANKTAVNKPGMTDTQSPNQESMFMAQRMNPQNIEIAPTEELEALPDEFFEYYMKTWSEESKRPKPPDSAPLKEEFQERFKVTAKKLELLGGRMMRMSNPQNIKFSKKHEENLSKLLRQGGSTQAAPGGATPPGFSTLPDPTVEYQEQTEAMGNEFREILTEWTESTKTKTTKNTNKPKGETNAGGKGQQDEKAIVVQGQSPESSSEAASIRMQSFPTHKPTHEAVNVSLETPNDSSPASPEGLSTDRFAFQRQARMSGASVMDAKNTQGGIPLANLQNFVTKQRKGLQQIKTAMDRATTPDEMSKISRQLASLAEGMEKTSLQLDQAIKDSKGKSENKTVPEGQEVSEAGPGDNPNQAIENIPSTKHKRAEGTPQKQDITSKLPDKLDELKQTKKDKSVTKSEGNIQVKKTPATLTTGSSSLKNIASQFAKLRTSLMGTTQPNKLKKITQEMINLSSQLDASGLEDVFLAGAEVRSGKKITGKYIVEGDGNLKPATKKSSKEFVYPEMGNIKEGKTLARVDSRKAETLPKEVKDAMTKLEQFNKKIKNSKTPKELEKTAKEIISFSQQLKQITPKRDEQTVAIIKEGVKREGGKVEELSNKIRKEKDPMKIDAYALELSRHAAKLKTIGKKADGVGWKEGKGIRSYASKLERTTKLLTKQNKSMKALGSNQYHEMALRRDAHRLEELSRIIATSKDPKKVQKAAKEMIKLSQELSDISYNLGTGKARTSFAPHARKTAQEAVREGGLKLQRLLKRIKEHRGALKVGDVGLQLKSIAGSLNKARGNQGKDLTNRESSNLKRISNDLSKMANQFAAKGTGSAYKTGSSSPKGTGNKVSLKNNPLNQLIPRLAQHADNLANMELASKGRIGGKHRGNNNYSNVKSQRDDRLKELEMGLQKSVDSNRLLEIASQLEELGQKLLKTPMSKDHDPTQRPWWQDGQAKSPEKPEKDLQDETVLLEMKRQAAIQKLDTFLDDLTQQKQKMGSYSIKDVSLNSAGDAKLVSAISKGVGGENRQSLFSKGDNTKRGHGVSGVPLSEDIDNLYPMEENLASNTAFEKIVKRVKRYRKKLTSMDLTTPTSKLHRVTPKRQPKKKSNSAQPQVKNDLRWQSGIQKGEKRKSSIRPNKNAGARKDLTVKSKKRLDHPADIINVPLSDDDLPEEVKKLNIPMENQNPKTEIDRKQQLAAQQNSSSPVNRSKIPQEYRNIIKRIYLYSPPGYL